MHLLIIVPLQLTLKLLDNAEMLNRRVLFLCFAIILIKWDPPELVRCQQRRHLSANLSLYRLL